MTALVLAVAAVVASAVASHAFHAWLRQRERERLSSIDRAELLKRIEAIDGRLLELKNTVANLRSR